MTAEIAILNKSAVALAADSAVTIGRPPNAKIYNTVNKIFELSAHEPIGIMVYGKLDFMGLPYETLIKEHRNLLKGTSFDHVSGYASNFRNFLTTEVPVSQRDADINVAIIINAYFGNANTEFDRRVRDDIAKNGNFKRSKLNGILQTLLRGEIAKAKSRPLALGFSTKMLAQEHVVIVDAVADDAFKNIVLTDQSRTLIRQWAGYLLSKDVLCGMRTGIVVAGFGAKEWCPSLVAFETDGLISGRLKFVERPPVDIGRNGPAADILGFAQDDMMKSFLEGVDPTIRQYLLTLASQGIMDTAKAVLKATINNPAQEAAALAALMPSLVQMQQEAQKKSGDYIDKVASSPIRDMIAAMPKQELARLADSLIELTSLKRKVTIGQETVGGEVDVAIISKSEGFVWTKRKHYFPADLNPRFFDRHH